MNTLFIHLFIYHLIIYLPSTIYLHLPTYLSYKISELCAFLEEGRAGKGGGDDKRERGGCMEGRKRAWGVCVAIDRIHFLMEGGG